MEIMDYEKAYKDVLAKAREIHRNEDGKRFDMEWLFPELKESDDERVRKALVEIFSLVKENKKPVVNKEDADLILAWLEKQGEKQTYQSNELAWLYLVADILTWKEGIGQYLDDPRVQEFAKKMQKEYSQKLYIEKQDNNNQNWKPSKEQINALEHFVRSIAESGYASPYDDNTKLLKSLMNDLHKLENQGDEKKDFHERYEEVTKSDWFKKSHEDKSCGMITDENECKPKFKVGDWVVFDNNLNGNSIYHIEKIENYHYTLRHILGGSLPLPFGNESHIRPWTINDAKDGNILAVNWVDENSNIWEKVVIFKSLGKNGVEGYGNTFKNKEKVFDVSVPYYSKSWTENLHPATNEQCDLLFKEMRKNGYRWDANKKELEKIVIDEGKDEMDDCFTKMMLSESSKQ